MGLYQYQVLIIVVRESIQQLVTCALMSTLVPWCVSSDTPWEDSISWTGGCRNYWPCFLTSVNVTGNICSKASTEEKASAQGLNVLWSEQKKLSVLSEEAKFPELQYSYGYTLNNNKQIMVATLQCHFILMQELENAVTPGELEVYRLVSILHAAASLKAVLPFDFVNTSGQKLSTLRTHFTQSYSALDILPNHYY